MSKKPIQNLTCYLFKEEISTFDNVFKKIDGISIESLKMAIALDAKKKIDDLTVEMKTKKDMLEVADIYYSMGDVVKKAHGQLQELDGK